MDFLKTVPVFLKTSARERAKQIPARMVLASVLALAFYANDKASWIWIWAAVAVATQIFEYVAMSAFRKDDDQDVKPVAVFAALASTAFMAVTYGGAGLLIWVTGNNVTANVAALSIAGGLLANLAAGIGSRALFYTGAAPYLMALGLMPVIMMIQGDVNGVILTGCTCVLSCLTVLSVFNRVHATRQSEQEALLEADRRVDQAQAAMADRSALAAIVSHELRTPVSAILAGASVIRAAPGAATTQDTAELIVDASRHMVGMLNDLLDHSKMEAGAMSIEARDFDLCVFVRDAVRFWRNQAADKGLTLQAELPNEGEFWLVGDPYRLRQIVNNLLSNAIKFTPRGMIRIDVEVSPIEGGRHGVVLKVTDQGTGILPEAMARLFTPFAQGSAEVARNYGGTGLGLTVSRELARLMGGDLTVASEQGAGAVFTLMLDLPPGQSVEEGEHHETTPPPVVHRLRVLAVDDNELNRRTLALVLKPLDIELVMASDGFLALSRLEEQTFDVVVMDVNMPGMDGNEATRRLRASAGPNAGIPVIGFSAGSEADQIACQAAGMTDWLSKPLEPRKLYDALQRAADMSSA